VDDCLDRLRPSAPLTAWVPIVTGCWTLPGTGSEIVVFDLRIAVVELGLD
jgi:hypothetical protein